MSAYAPDASRVLREVETKHGTPVYNQVRQLLETRFENREDRQMIEATDVEQALNDALETTKPTTGSMTEGWGIPDGARK